MKSEIIENSGLKRVIRVHVDKGEVSSALEKEFKKIQKTTELKGFRKGKAPLDQIKAMYGSRVSQNVLESLVNKNYISALDDLDLQPIASPKIDLASGEEKEEDTDGGFTFTAEFEVKPEIEIKDLSTITVEKQASEVEDKEVEEQLSHMAAAKAEVSPVLEDRPAKSGDWVKIDFDGTLKESGEPVENGSAKDFLLELGSKSLIEGFEDGIEGMKVDTEKTLSLKFPEDYFQKDLAGQGVDFKVKLNSINKKDFPEINDEFASNNSPCKNLEELKNQIKEDLKNSKEKQAEQKLSDDLLLAFANMHEVDLPQSIIEEQAKSFKSSTEQRLLQQGLQESDLSSYHEKWEEDYKKNAVQSVKISFLVEALASKENLYPDQNAMENYYTDISAQTGIEVDKIKSYYGSPEKSRELEFKIMEENVVAFLKEKATIK